MHIVREKQINGNKREKKKRPNRWEVNYIVDNGVCLWEQPT